MGENHLVFRQGARLVREHEVYLSRATRLKRTIAGDTKSNTCLTHLFDQISCSRCCMLLGPAAGSLWHQKRSVLESELDVLRSTMLGSLLIWKAKASLISVGRAVGRKLTSQGGDEPRTISKHTYKLTGMIWYRIILQSTGVKASSRNSCCYTHLCKAVQ